MRRPGVKIQLFLVLFSFAVLLIAAFAFATHWSVRKGVVEYVGNVELARLEPFREHLTEYWIREGNWRGLHRDMRRWRGLIYESFPPSMSRPNERHRRQPYDPSGLLMRVRLLDEEKRFVTGVPNFRSDRPRLIPIHAGEKTVGWLSVSPPPIMHDNLLQRFFNHQYLMLFLTAFGALLVAAGASVWLGKRLLTPVESIAHKVRQIASGEKADPLDIPRRDELGVLATDVNHLADVLEKNETLRRAAMADISHELRTPLALLRGNIEAMQDGVLPCDEEQLNGLHNAVTRLTRLVDDLYDMALADAGALRFEFVTLDLSRFLTDAMEHAAPAIASAGLTAETQVEHALPVRGDPRRLQQIIDNLLQNSLRYTDAGGHLKLLAERQGKEAVVTLSDSAPGVSDAALEKLFNRFFRAETSRDRNQGGAGLGLSIVQSLVRAHGGSIEAAHSPLGGVTITLRLPLI